MGVIPATIGLVALFLGLLEGRAGVLALRSATGPGRSALGRLSTIVIVSAATANIVWLFSTWPWYWSLLVLIAIIIASTVLVTGRSLRFWLEVRYLVAIATAASTGILWMAYRPPP